jgi:hypothetical protein
LVFVVIYKSKGTGILFVLLIAESNMSI